MTTGYPDRPLMSFSHTCLPYGLYVREPTTARNFIDSSGKLPRIVSDVGVSGISRRSMGIESGSMGCIDISIKYGYGYVEHPANGRV